MCGSCEVSCSSFRLRCSAGFHRLLHKWIFSIHHYRRIHTFLQSNSSRALDPQSLQSRRCSYRQKRIIQSKLGIIILGTCQTNKIVLWFVYIPKVWKQFVNQRILTCRLIETIFLPTVVVSQRHLHLQFCIYPWVPRSALGIGSKVEHLSPLRLTTSQPSSSEKSLQSDSPLQRRDWLMQRPGQDREAFFYVYGGGGARRKHPQL